MCGATLGQYTGVFCGVQKGKTRNIGLIGIPSVALESGEQGGSIGCGHVTVGRSLWCFVSHLYFSLFKVNVMRGHDVI